MTHLQLSYSNKKPSTVKENEIVVLPDFSIYSGKKVLDINDVVIGYPLLVHLHGIDNYNEPVIQSFLNDLETFEQDLKLRWNSVNINLQNEYEKDKETLFANINFHLSEKKYTKETRDSFIANLTDFRNTIHLIEVEIEKLKWVSYENILRNLSENQLLKLFFNTNEEYIQKPNKTIDFWIGNYEPTLSNEPYLSNVDKDNYIFYSTKTNTLYKYNGENWVVVDNSVIEIPEETISDTLIYFSQPLSYKKDSIWISNTGIKKSIKDSLTYNESDWVDIFKPTDTSALEKELNSLKEELVKNKLFDLKTSEEFTKLIYSLFDNTGKINNSLLNIDSIKELLSQNNSQFVTFDTFSKEITGINNKINSLGTLSNKNKISKSDLDDSIIKNGYIDNSLINFTFDSGSFVTQTALEAAMKLRDLFTQEYIDYKIISKQLGLSELAYKESIGWHNFDESIKSNNYLNLDLFNIDGLILRGNITTNDKLNSLEDNSVSKAKQYLDNRITNRLLGVSDLAYKQFISFADFDGTIVADGFIKTELINANAIILNSGRSITEEAVYNYEKSLRESSKYVDNLILRRELGVSDLAYKQLIGFRDLDGTIITGNFIKTELINARALIIGGPNGIPTDYIDASNSEILNNFYDLTDKVEVAENLYNELVSDAIITKDILRDIISDDNITTYEKEQLKLRFIECGKNYDSVIAQANLFNSDSSIQGYIDNYKNAWEELKKVVEPILADEREIIPIDKVLMMSAFNNFFNSEGNLQHIIIKKARDTSKSYTDSLRNEVKYDTNQLFNRIIETKDGLTILFEDGVVTAEERAILRNLLNLMEGDYAKVVLRYNQIYNDTAFVDQTLKQELFEKFETFNNSKYTLTNVINQIIADDEVTTYEKENFNNVINDYQDSLSELSKILDKSIISIMDSHLDSVKDDVLKQVGKTLEDYIKVTEYNVDIANIQSQLDGNLTNWFENGVPTLTNIPASDWTTPELKEEHVGDMYYDTLNNNAYRFLKNSTGDYEWKLIEDSDTAMVLQKVKDAYDLADGKRRIFYNTPTPPYDFGDLWIRDGEVYRSNSDKDINSVFELSDWLAATKYTDDTKALESLALVNNIYSDDILTPSEKHQLKIIYQQIIMETNQILAEALQVGYESTDPDYLTLHNYVVPQSSTIKQTFADILSNKNINENTTISGEQIRSVLNNYYNHFGNLKSGIATKRSLRDSTLDQYLGLNDEVTRAKLQGTSLIVGGWIKTDFIDTNALLVRGEDNTSTSLSDYLTGLKNSVSNIQVGGRNLLLNSKNERVTTATEEYWQRYDSIYDNNPELVGRQVMVSFYLETDSVFNMWLYCYNDSNIGFGQAFTFPTKIGKHYYSFPFTISKYNGRDIYPSKLALEFYDLSTSNSFKTSLVQMEFGTIATSYTEAPEDILSTINSKTTTTTSSTTPLNPNKGDIWIDTGNGNVIKVFSGSTWDIYRDSSKNRTFVQPDKPTSTSTYTLVQGDIWIDSDNNNIIHIYQGNDFVSYRDNQITIDMIRINDMADDNKLTPIEKSLLKKEWKEIQEEYQTLILTCSEYSIPLPENIGYKKAYSDLNILITSLNINNQTTTNIPGGGGNLRNIFTTYYNQRELVEQQITDYLNTKIINVNTVAERADNAASQANQNIGYILSDKYVTQNEKVDIYKEYKVILSERDSINLLAQSLSLSNINYNNSVNNITNFLIDNPVFGVDLNNPDLQNLYEFSSQTLATELRDLFVEYYKQKQLILNSSTSTIDQKLSDQIGDFDKLRGFIAGDQTLNELEALAANNNTLIKGGKINTTYINTQALLVGDANMWRLYNYSSGYMMYKDPDFKYGFNSVEHQNIVELGNSSLTRIEVGIGADNKPTNSKYILRFISSGDPSYIEPYYGMFKFENTVKPNDIFVLKIIAKIPVGFIMHVIHGYLGEGGTSGWLTPQEGTGKYQEYLSYVTIGPPGSSIPVGLGPVNYILFSTNDTIPSSDAGPITVDIAYATVFDLNRSENDEINYLYSNIFGISYDEAKTNALGGHTLIKGGMINTDLVNTNALIVRNGDQSLGTLIVGDSLNTNLIAANSIKSDMIDTRGLTIKDSSGNIIFGSGKKLDLSNDTENTPSTWLNNNISINSDGTLSGAGEGRVTIGGLGYTGALDANKTYIAADGTIQGVSSGTNTQVSNSNITIQNGRIQGIGSGSGELISTNTTGFISQPEGGYYNQSGNITGRIKVKLPQSWTNTTLRFFIDVFLYNTNKSFTLEVGGYIYENQEWHSCSAKITGDLSHEYPVYFGYADGKCCIWVGELNTIWDYPIIKIRDVSLGHSNQEKEKWETGWNISIDTSELTNNIPTAHNQFSFKISDTLTGAKWAKVGGDGRPEDNATLGATVGKDVKIITTSSGTQTLVQDSFINQWNKMSASNVNTFMQSATIGDAHIINLNAAKVEVGNTSLTVDVNGVSKIRTQHIDAQSLIINNNLTTVSQSQLYADNAAQNAVNSLQIGGRNYFLQGGAVRTISLNTFPTLIQNGVFPLSTEFAVSFYAKVISGSGRALIAEFHGGIGATLFTLTTEFKRYTTIMSTQDEHPIWYIWMIDSPAEIQIKDIMIVKGNRPMDYTPAPEDIDANIQAVRTETQTKFAVIDGQISGIVSETTEGSLGYRVKQAEAKITPDAINFTVKQQIDTKVNDIQIGGRNLLKSNHTTSEQLIAGETYTLSFRIQEPSSPGYKFVHIWRINQSWGSDAFPTISIDSRTDKIVITFICPVTDFYCFVLEAQDHNYSFSEKPKLEKGNKATDWTPAPEDIEADITALNTRVTTSETNITQLSNSISLKADSTSVTNLETRLNSAEAKIEPEAITMTVTERIQIGGENLLLNSETTSPHIWSANDTGTYYYNPEDSQNTSRIIDRNGKKWFYIRAYDGYHASIYGYNISPLLEKNQTYTFSILVNQTSGSDKTVNAYIEHYAATSVIIPSNTPTKITQTFTTGNTIPNTPFIILYIDNIDFEVREFQLEKGNKATDWSKSQKEIDSEILSRPTSEQLKSEFTITPGGISMLGKTISLAGMVTFDSLNLDVKSKVNDIANKVNYQNLYNLGFTSNDLQGTQTFINGGYIKSNFINVDTLVVGGGKTLIQDINEKINYSSNKISDKKKVRYIRCWANGSSVNEGNHWVEVKALDKNGNNLALNKNVTSNYPISGNPSHLVDGSINTQEYISTSTPSRLLGYMQIDLGEVRTDIEYIHMWMYYHDNRIYQDVKIEISEDGNYWIPVFETTKYGEYNQTSKGLLVPVNKQTSNEINLLKDSFQKFDNNLYLSNSYYLNKDLEVGRFYTISIKATLGGDRTWMSIYNENGQVSLVTFLPSDSIDGIFTKTVLLKNNYYNNEGFWSKNLPLRLYIGPHTASSTSAIEWIKIEEGMEATPYIIPENEIIIGGENYYNSSTPISVYSASGLSKNATGFHVVGVPEGTGEVRLNNVINSNGWWVVSFEHQFDYPGYELQIDICDKGLKKFSFPDTNWNKVEHAVYIYNYSSDIYNFVDIRGLTSQYHRFRNFQVQKGNKATEYRESLIDVNKRINDAVSDEVLTPSEKAAFKIQIEQVVKESEDLLNKASKYPNIDVGIKSTYTTWVYYITDPVGYVYDRVYNNPSGNTAVNSTSFKSEWSNYFTAKANFETEIERCSKLYADNASKNSIGLTNLLYQSNVLIRNTTNDYLIGSYRIHQKLTVGKTYTLSVKTNNSSTQLIGAWVNGNQHIGNCTMVDGGITSLTFTRTDIGEGTVIDFYNFSNPRNAWVEIVWAVLVEGNKAPDFWIESPQDNIFNSVKGKNLLSKSLYDIKPGVRLYHDGSLYTPHGNYVTNHKLIPINPNTQYYLSYYSAVPRDEIAILYYSKEGSYVGNSGSNTTTFITPSNCYYLGFDLKVSGQNSSADHWNKLYKVKLEQGWEATPFTPAEGDDYQIISEMSYLTDLLEKQTDNTTIIRKGLITTNLIKVGQTFNNSNAGINGAGTTNDSIRFFAGASADNMVNAPFRVTHGGDLYSVKGFIGGWYIGDNKLVSKAPNPDGTFTGRRTEMLGNGDIVKYADDGKMTSIESSSTGIDEKIYYTRDGNGNAVASVKMGAYGFKTLGSPEQFTPVRILLVSSNAKTNVPIVNDITNILATHTQLNIQLPGGFTNTIFYNNLNDGARYYTPPKDANGNIVVGSHPEGYVVGDNFPDVKIGNGWYLLDGYANFGEQTSYVQKIYYVENGLKLDNVYVNAPIYQATVDVYMSVTVYASGSNNIYQIKYHSVFSDNSGFNDQITCVFNFQGFGSSDDGNKSIILTDFSHNVTEHVVNDPIIAPPVSNFKFITLQSQDKFLIYANSKYYFVRIHSLFAEEI